MSFETEAVLDRRRLRRRLSIWRVLAIFAGTLALGLLLFSSAERAGLLEQRQIARVTIEGLITDDRDLLRLLAKVGEMKGKDRAMAKRLHAIVTDSAPNLWPKTWYGMPAYARDGKVVCFFTPASKFKERYASFGFNAAANLDEGNMWPTSFAILKIGPAEERKITALLKKAVS